MILDAHQHFWHYSPEEYGWIGERLACIRRDFLPDDLAREQDAFGADGSVAVQARQTLAETEWLLDLADRHPRIQAVVGWLDLRSPDLPAQIERFADRPKLKGVRHVVQDEPDDRFIIRDDFARGVGMLTCHDLAYDILIVPRQLRAAIELVARFPEQRFILNHIAKPFIGRREMEPWATQVRQLASHPNVACKVSGMVTETRWHAWRREEFFPYLDVVFDAFGCERLMVGSDWPVCLVSGSYAETMGIATAYVEALSADERARVLAGTAKEWYRIAGVC